MLVVELMLEVILEIYTNAQNLTTRWVQLVPLCTVCVHSCMLRHQILPNFHRQHVCPIFSLLVALALSYSHYNPWLSQSRRE
jgi:hypothetical protein